MIGLTIMGFLFQLCYKDRVTHFQDFGRKFLVNRDFKMGRFAVKKLLPY